MVGLMLDLATCLEWTVDRYPHRRAVGGPQPLTYRQWWARVQRLARALAEQGVRPGDRVVLLLAGGEPLASLHLACQLLGAVSVPLSTRFGHAELAYCLDDCAPRLAVADATTVEALTQAEQQAEKPIPLLYAEAPGEQATGLLGLHELAERQADSPLDTRPRPEDVSLMLYTSGTTGRPKGVPRTHAAEHAAAVAHLIQTGHAPGEITLGVMPLFHTMGVRSLLASIAAAGTWVPQAKFDAETSLELIESEGVTALYLVPTIYWALLQTGRIDALRSVRKLAYAGAAMTPALAEKLTDALTPERFVNHFGSTEIYTFTISPDGLTKPGCAGRAGVFSRIRIVAPEPGAAPDDLVGPGEQGQVIASLASPEAFVGYWNRPDADAKAIRDGWYYTGDLATTDDDGDLWVAGRVDDMINSGGENIYPDEIEAELARCPAIADVVVAGLPDERWGHAVTAFAVPGNGLEPGTALDELTAFARERLPGLKRPKRYVAVREVPKSAVGKILRRELREGGFEALAERKP
jgi:2-furoate---CoA ligase